LVARFTSSLEVTTRLCSPANEADTHRDRLAAWLSGPG
jgi:hypothetical protein